MEARYYKPLHYAAVQRDAALLTESHPPKNTHPESQNRNLKLDVVFWLSKYRPYLRVVGMCWQQSKKRHRGDRLAYESICGRLDAA